KVSTIPLLPIRKLGLKRRVTSRDALAVDLAHRSPIALNHFLDDSIHDSMGSGVQTGGYRKFRINGNGPCLRNSRALRRSEKDQHYQFLGNVKEAVLGIGFDEN